MARKERERRTSRTETQSWAAGWDSRRKRKKKDKDVCFVMTVSSHAVGKMCVHMLQQSGWKTQTCRIHSSREIALMVACLAKSSLYPPIPSSAFSSSFHITFSPHHEHLHSICFNKPTPLPGPHLTRKQAAPFYSSWKTEENTNGTANSPGGVCWRQKCLIIKCCPVQLELVPPRCLDCPASDRSGAPVSRKMKKLRSSRGLDQPTCVKWERMKKHETPGLSEHPR